MKTLLVSLILLLGQQSARPSVGTMSGQLRDVNGVPAAGVRVGLTPVESGAGVGTLSNITETDRDGRFRLENVPPGRYLIAAGALVSMTYFPGVTTRDQGRIVTIVAGQALTNLDFTVAVLARTAPPLGRGGVAGGVTSVISLPMSIRVDNGSQTPGVGALPMEFRIGRHVGELRLSPPGPVVPGTPWYEIKQWVSKGSLHLQSFELGPNVVTVTKVPLGYYVKSMTLAKVDLTRAPLVLPLTPGDAQIEVVLTKTPPSGKPSGVKVSGRVTNAEFPLSGNIGLVLTEVTPTGVPVVIGTAANAMDAQASRKDGVFEIQDVPPGRYTLQIGGPFGFYMPPQSPSLTFDVGRSDIRNLVLRFEEPATVAKPDTPVPLNPSSITSISGMVDATSGSIPMFELRFTATRGSAAQSVTISGREFSVQLPEGEYRASISGLPQGFAVESISAGPIDLKEAFLVTKAGIADRFTGTPISAGITIRLRN